MNNGKRYYGKYRGSVINNVDPMLMGRLQVMVPDVMNVLPSSWAMPCVPVAGLQMGIFAVPPIGAGVWVEFEQGDPDYPIWTGCFVGSPADVPLAARSIVPPISGITLQTMLQNSLVVSDLPPSPATGGIVLRSALGAMIVVNDSGIYIQNGKGASIVLFGKSVDINTGAFTVT